jgi:hypothetical protein
MTAEKQYKRGRVKANSKYGFQLVRDDSEKERHVPIVGPGGREIPMTLPKLNIPPAYED